MPQIVIYGENCEKHVIEVPEGDGRYYAIRALQLGAKLAEWPASEDCPPFRFDQVGIRALAREQVKEMQNGLPITAKC